MPGDKKPKVSSRAIKDKKTRIAFVVLALIIGIAGVYCAYYAGFLGLANQILVALIVLVVIGNLIRFYGGYMGWNALYLLSTQKGIKFIDSISKNHKTFWESLSLWGIVIGLGLLAWPFLKGKISKKLFVFGIISLLFMYLLVLPFTIYGVQFISLSQVQTLLQNASPATSVASPFASVISFAVAAITVITGFSGLVLALLIYNAISVISGIAAFFVSVSVGAPSTSSLTNQVPGVIPVIPGITVPLFAGLAAIVILLVVHEGSHGVLARIAKVKLRSVGLLMFGAIPVGAFVEPDEKEVMKLDPMKQTKIFAAGSSMNFLFAAIFFVLVYLFLIYVIPTLSANMVLVKSTVPGYPAYNALQPGMQILKWNGYPVQNISSFTVAAANDTANAVITVVTNTGSYAFKAVGVGGNSTRGVIGVDVYQPLKNTPLSNAEYFLYTVFALSLMFNFFVAIFNLLPLPMFDGWRIYKSNIKNDKITKWLGIIIGVALIVNVLSLFFVLFIK